MFTDYYLRWEGITDAERQVQVSHDKASYCPTAWQERGFGEIGLARWLLVEVLSHDWNATPEGPQIRSELLRARLPFAKSLAKEQQLAVCGHSYGSKATRKTILKLEQFVVFAEVIEKMTGQPCRVYMRG